MIRFISDYNEKYDMDIFNNECVRCWFSVSGNLVLWMHRSHIVIKLNTVFDSSGLLNQDVVDFLGNHVYEFAKHIKEKNINAWDFEKKFQELCP
jgi:hypothetical protein